MKRLPALLATSLLAVVAASACAHAPKPVSQTKPPEPASKPQLTVKAEPTPAPVDTGAEELATIARETAVFFDFDSDLLKPEGQQHLRRAADVLRKHPDLKVRVEGNCDERGTVEYNLALGQRRANVARKYLVALGVSEGQVSEVSYGSERPLVEGHDEQAWARNRRDDLRAGQL